jgi:spermidine/putrescine transport system ATP-binding protein
MANKGSSSEEHVVLERVSKRYGEMVAVSDLSLAVGEGELLMMIGPSGSGKSTTLRCIAGLEQLTSGAIYVRGQRIDTTPIHKRDMAMVWQEHILFPHMDVERNIEFGLKMRGVDKQIRRKKVLETLRTVGLDVPLNRRVDELSGGERQRVGLARALVTQPQVLLLDEPMASLDRNLRVTMQAELKAVQKELGITFIYVTHNQSEALAIGDRIVIMNEGGIEQIDTPKGLFESPKTRFVAEFVGENNVFEGKVVSTDNRGKVIVESAGRNFNLLVDGETPPEGKEVIFTVRADIMSMDVTDDAKASDNTLHATIVGEEYFGTVVKFTLKSKDGRSLEVIKPVGLYPGGNEAILSWDATNTYLLPWNS